MFVYKLSGVFKIMDKKALKNYIEKGKLLAIVSPKTTFKKCCVDWYVVKNNKLLYVDETSSAVNGMSRILDCYFKLLNQYDLAELSSIQNYEIID